ncbi:hypothetical protein BDZ89DRAFT_957146 [Hymenopellis radicata]|nr:hypothetical protein BDZ89DRAFT_957146 [Hymenopellis radicata]
MMAAIQRILSARGIDFDKDMNRVRCFPHCINLAVKAGLSYMTVIKSDDEELDGYDLELDERLDNLTADIDYLFELEDDVVGKVRKLVNACRASGGRRDKLAETIREGNEKEWWRDDKNQAHTMRVLALLRDVDTRWSSVYYMVDRLLYLYPAVERTANASDSDDLKSLCLNDLQRRILKDIRLFLHVFHSVQELGSAEKTPTLSIVLPLYEKLLQLLRVLPNSVPNLTHAIRASVAKLTEYNELIRRNPVYTLAICELIIFPFLIKLTLD